MLNALTDDITNTSIWCSMNKSINQANEYLINSTGILVWRSQALTTPLEAPPPTPFLRRSPKKQPLLVFGHLRRKGGGSHGRSQSLTEQQKGMSISEVFF